MKGCEIMRIDIDSAKRVKDLPPYLFAEIDEMIEQAKDNGVDVINFGIGDPDLPTPDHIVNAMKEAVMDPATHSYPSYEGMIEYRKAVANWYEERFSVDIDPATEVISLIGSKEGLANFPLCYINPGDLALIPDPSYPVYKTAVLLAGGETISLPLKTENDFLVDLDSVKNEYLNKAKLIYLNYPNNPTGAIADRSFFKKIVDYAQEYNFIVVHDAAYSEIGLDGYQPPSLLEVEGAREVGIEFGSLSKTFNMTGWRIGWVLGNSEIIDTLSTIKTNIDSGVFEAIQRAGITALKGDKTCVDDTISIYEKRRDLLVSGLNKIGWDIEPNIASFYLWMGIPENFSDSKEFSQYIFEKTGVFFTPGIGYGEEGKNYVRIALTVSEDRIKEALKRLEEEF